MDPGYSLRVEEEGAVSVVAAAHDGPLDDEADNVAEGQQRPRSRAIQVCIRKRVLAKSGEKASQRRA
jgi:hypothetical protein